MRTEPAAYLDHGATSPLRPEASAAMLPHLEASANASSAHASGQRARLAVERAREAVGALLGAGDPGEITFTSGGTEALNLAIRGVVRARPGLSLAATAIEHPAVLRTMEDLSDGRGPRLLVVDGRGVVEAEALRDLGRAPTLAAVMLASHETGTLQPVAEAASAVKDGGGLLLVDAVHAAGKVPLVSTRSGADLVAVSGHKMGGPQGVGALWIRPGTPFHSSVTGGAQERGRRAGTENVAAIAGMGAAARAIASGLAEQASRLGSLRDRLETEILGLAPWATVLGAAASRVPGTTCVLLPGVDGESLVFGLDLKGVCASTGAACATGSAEPSHVLAALGVPAALRRSALRLTLGWSSSEEDVSRLVQGLRELLPALRAAEGRAPGPV